jgi:hypothetical protein
MRFIGYLKVRLKPDPTPEARTYEATV